MSAQDTLVRRQIFVDRFSASESRRFQAGIRRLYATIQARLLREPSATLEARLLNIRRDLDVIINQGFREMSEEFKQLAMNFGESEARFTRLAYGANSTVPLSVESIASLQASLLDSALDIPIGPKTKSLLEAINDFTRGRANDIRIAIGDGVLLGETTPQIAARVQELAAGRHRAQVESLVRTTINHTAAQSRKAVTMQNAELFKSEEWVAVLDTGTTLICGGRDGREYPIGRGPYPPAHWRCRSIRVAQLKDEFNKGGAFKKKQNFDDWLRGQPAKFQDEYFSQFPDGLEKAALFRRGKLPIQNFRDETGRDFTLEELRALEPVAFDDANVELDP